jgi:hypothetical protein
VPGYQESHRRAFEAAYSVAAGLSVDDLHRRTGRSRPSLYRDLEIARNLGWLDDRPRLAMPYGEARLELEATLRDFRLADSVLDLFASPVRPQEVIVAPTAPPTPEEEVEEAVCAALRRFISRRETEAQRAPDQAPDSGTRVCDVTELTGLDVSDLAAEVCSVNPVIRALAAEAFASDVGRRLTDLVARHVTEPYTRRDVRRSERVGLAAADRFLEALAAGALQRVGLSWGHNVAVFVKALRLEFPGSGRQLSPAEKQLQERAHDLRIFALIGSLGLDTRLDAREAGTSRGANANCGNLAARLGAPPPLALTQPALISGRYYDPYAAGPLGSATRLTMAWRYIEADASIMEVYGQGVGSRRVTENGDPQPDPAVEFAATGTLSGADGGLIAEADALITGVGPGTEDSRLRRLRMLSPRDVEVAGEAGVVGDVSGRLFWPPTAPPSGDLRRKVAAINARIIGPTLADFIHVTRRAREKRAADPAHLALGTMVVTSGPDKANAVRRLVEYGAVHTLVIDADLAAELIRQAGR